MSCHAAAITAASAVGFNIKSIDLGNKINTSCCRACSPSCGSAVASARHHARLADPTAAPHGGACRRCACCGWHHRLRCGFVEHTVCPSCLCLACCTSSVLSISRRSAAARGCWGREAGRKLSSRAKPLDWTGLPSRALLRLDKRNFSGCGGCCATPLIQEPA